MMLAAALLLVGGAAAILPSALAPSGRTDIRRRLRAASATDDEPPARRKPAIEVHEKAAKTAQEFYARSDPENVARLRLKLIQAGYMDPRAVGLFFVVRIGGAVCLALAAFALGLIYGGEAAATNRWMFVGLSGGAGYFLPGLVLSQKARARTLEYRNGFPDFMDLMIVCADAGMSMEAAIERVSRELLVTYPALAQNLRLVSIELRAGRNLDDALKSLAERLSVDEVRSFATLLQQSRELGTSLSGALRVFSDEMRHKRMSLAEEKAHALPAKMSVPVTVCILPVVMMVALIPIIVKLSSP
ncbi:MAG: type II secretion system F family protein [Rhizobiaceae bacterium]|nr:type II secretion system F family protein [Rhizobiaceae bacterium]MCV0408269.1 type II secretion system F family protein [Rhizobiaceae bacterium]